MHTSRILISFFVAAIMASAPRGHAKEPKAAAVVRDGSTKERAIVVTEPQSNYMYWEYQYLDKHFPGRAFPMEHGLVADEPPDRAWDEHTFMWRGRKTVVWFDITKQFRAFSKAHPADRWSSPDKFYSFAPPQGWTHREDAPGSHRSFAWISPDGKAEIRISANYDLVRLPKELPDQIVDAFLGNERGITPMQKVRGTGWDGLRREYTNADQSTRWLVVSARSGTTLVGLTMSAPEAEFERFRPIFESVSNSLKLRE